MLVSVTLPLTVSGVGFAPKMYFSAWARISWRRQRHSTFDATRVPSSFLKGSGSFGIAVSALASGSVLTAQSAL